MKPYLTLLLILFFAPIVHSQELVDGSTPSTKSIYDPGTNSQEAKESPTVFKLKEQIFLPFDQSDWSVLANPKQIEKVTLSGFKSFNEGDEISVVVTDENHLKAIAEAFTQYQSFRNALSDVSGCGFPVSFGKHNVGTLTLQMKNQVIRVGLTREGFILGYDEGSLRQTFFNPMLSSKISQLLPDSVANSYLEILHAGLSGIRYFEVPQPDLVLKNGKVVVSDNPVRHPKNVDVPENIPFAIATDDQDKSKITFAANRFREGHYFGWVNFLEEYRSEKEKVNADQLDPKKYWRSGFEAGYDRCSTTISLLEKRAGRDTVIDLINQSLNQSDSD